MPVWHLKHGSASLSLSLSVSFSWGFYSLISNLICEGISTVVWFKYIFFLNPVLNELNRGSVYFLSFILCQCQIMPNFIAEIMEW